jgi:cobalt transporter subunit CbtB
MILQPLQGGNARLMTPIRDLMNTTTTALPESRTKSLTNDKSVVGALTLLLGLGFVYFVGFAPLSAVHNAAHDTRHSAAFPCH